MSNSSSANRVPQVLAIGIPFSIIPTVAVVLRIWSRTLIHTSGFSKTRRFWWDDWLVVICLPFVLAASTLDLSWSTFGLGRHMAQVSVPDLDKGLQVLWSVLWLYSIAIWLSKLSALAFYARVFSLGNKKFRLALWIVAGLACAWIVTILVSLILQCHPVQKAWERAIPGVCQDPYNWWLAGGLSSFILDLIILLLPLPMLWRLQVKPSRKWLIICVFLSGYSVVFVSLGRVVQQIVDKPAHGPYLADFTYDVIPGGKWLNIESPIAIFCLCLPSIFALIKKGVDCGPRALFAPSRQLVSLESHTDRVTMLRQAFDDEYAFDNTYALPLSAAGTSAGSQATVSGGYSNGPRKTARASIHDPDVIHVHTEISVVTGPTWVDLTGVDI